MPLQDANPTPSFGGFGLSVGEISRRHAALELGIGYATLKRLIDAQSTGV